MHVRLSFLASVVLIVITGSGVIFCAGMQKGITRLIDLAANEITEVSWMDTLNHRHTVQRMDGSWYYAGMEAMNDGEFNAYIKRLVKVDGIPTMTTVDVLGLHWVEQISVAGKDSISTIITLYKPADDVYLLHSTAHPGLIFKSDRAGLYKQIFLDLTFFWGT